jgi:hypothetical protein
LEISSKPISGNQKGSAPENKKNNKRKVFAHLKPTRKGVNFLIKDIPICICQLMTQLNNRK